MSFDVLVRNFFDTDANPVVIEKFTNCNMDPASNNFIGVKIGTSNGEYALLSKYVMVFSVKNRNLVKYENQNSVKIKIVNLVRFLLKNLK